MQSPETIWNSNILVQADLGLHISMATSPQPQYRVVNRNTLRGYPVVLKGTGNHMDTKVSEPVELDLFFPSVK